MNSILTGQSENHLVDIPGIPRKIHKDALGDFLLLKEAATKAGLDMYIASSFRDYASQMSIWVEKAAGNRVLLDSAGVPVKYEDLNQDELLETIMRWSAIPGASRHHWGTDIDVFDNLSKPTPEYYVELTPQECAPDGCFGKFHLWLDERIERNESFGFFRPYASDDIGVSQEKWHISYAPVSMKLLEQYSEDFFISMIKNSELPLKKILLARAPEFYHSHVKAITPPPWA